jgi:hypothetical protein
LTDADEVSAMTRNRVLSHLVVLSTLAPPLCRARVPAPAPSFTISASNVTMPSSGTVTIPFMLTSVNGFAGMVAVNCTAPTVPAGVKAPYCYDGGPVRAYTLTADGTTTGGMEIVASKPSVVPETTGLNHLNHGEGASWAVAGVLILGIGLQRKRTRRFPRVSLATGMILALAGIEICGCGGPPTLTPGAYPFTLNANSVSISPVLTASTTATVTVPAGIGTHSSN